MKGLGQSNLEQAWVLQVQVARIASSYLRHLQLASCRVLADSLHLVFAKPPQKRLEPLLAQPATTLICESMVCMQLLMLEQGWYPGVNIGFGDWTRESGIGPGPRPRPGFQR